VWSRTPIRCYCNEDLYLVEVDSGRGTRSMAPRKVASREVPLNLRRRCQQGPFP